MASFDENYLDVVDSEDDGFSLIDDDSFAKDEKKDSKEASEESEKIAEEAVTEENFDAVSEEASKLFESRKYKEALEKYELLYKFDKGSTNIVNRTAYLYAVRGCLKKYLAVSLEWCKHLEAKEQFELFGAVCRRLLDLYPNSLDARLGYLHYIEKVKTEDDYTAAVIKDSAYFIDIGEGERSVSLLKVALNAHPARMELAVKLADIHMQLGNIKECTSQCRSIAAFYEFHKDHAKAAELYRRLRMLTPDDISIALRLSELYFMDGRFEDAVSEYRSCLHITYNHRDALFGLAKSLEKLEKYSDASLALRKILADNDGDVEAREKLGDIYLAEDNKDEALKCYTAASKNYYEFKEYESAVRVLNIILEKIDASNAYALREIGNAKEALQQKENRAAKIAKMAEQAKLAQEAAKSKTAEQKETSSASSSFSEDDLYADDGPVGDFDGDLDDLEELGGLDSEDSDSASNELDEDFSPLMAGVVEESKQKKKVKKQRKEPELTRVLYKQHAAGTLQVPPPFVLASYPDTIELMQQILTEPPAQDIFGWTLLEDIDAKIEEEKEAAEEAAVEAKKAAAARRNQAGPVASAFSKSGGSLFGNSAFGGVNAVSSNHRRKRRRSNWEDMDDEEYSSRGGSLGIQNALSKRFSGE